MRRITSLLVWFAMLEGFWALLVGTQQNTELVGGLGAAALGAVFAECLRTLGLLRFTTDVRLLAKAWKLPWYLLVDFAILSLASVRGTKAVWVEQPVDYDAWGRAFAAVAGSATPNAIVVDVDEERALLHSLDTRVPSGRRAV